mgnify:CR=1 FL=1
MTLAWQGAREKGQESLEQREGMYRGVTRLTEGRATRRPETSRRETQQSMGKAPRYEGAGGASTEFGAAPRGAASSAHGSSTGSRASPQVVQVLVADA